MHEGGCEDAAAGSLTASAGQLQRSGLGAGAGARIYKRHASARREGRAGLAPAN